MLAPCTSAGVPFDAEVTLVPGDAWCVLWVDYRDGNGLCVDSSLAFSRRNALDSMSACFVAKLGKVGASYNN